MKTPMRCWLLFAQGAYYLAAGLWPIVSIQTFQLVTGPKADLWLVKTVGMLVAVIGATLLLAVRRGVISPEVKLAALGSALGLLVVDVGYVATHTIAPIYLADAVVELLILVMWTPGFLRHR